MVDAIDTVVTQFLQIAGVVAVVWVMVKGRKILHWRRSAHGRATQDRLSRQQAEQMRIINDRDAGCRTWWSDRFYEHNTRQTVLCAFCGFYLPEGTDGVSCCDGQAAWRRAERAEALKGGVR